MEKRTFQNLDVESSLLGFGCMRFPLDKNGKIDEPLAEQMMDDAMAAGVTYYDTAVPYHEGSSEPFVGRVLEKYPRESYLLATKLPCWDVNDKSDVRRLFDMQMKKLNKDYFDFYLLHALDLGRFRKMRDLGVIEECEKLKAEAKIRFLGFSFHDNYEAFEEMITYKKWDFCQLQINYMDQNDQAGLKGLRLAESLGIPVIVMEPVKGGQLAVLPDDVKAPFEKIDSSKTPSSWALRWVASQPNVKVILSGMSTPAQVSDNLNTFTNFKPLTQEEFAAVDEVMHNLKARVKNGCTACRYCMPCPAGVDIPGNFAHWNGYGMYENRDTALRGWKNNMPEEKQAKNCIGCGKCETVCPQQLHIREDLKQVQATFDGLLKE